MKNTMLNCSGNPLHILIAILVYGVFAIFALAVGLASFSSFSNFVVGATVLLGPVGCYLFAFGLFNIRTRCTLVERFRHTKQYPFYCVCVMLSWLLLCFFCNVPRRRRIRQQKVKAV